MTKRSPARIRVPDDLARQMRGLHPEIKRTLRRGLDLIAGSPDHGKVLKQELAGLRSLRLRKFRLIYRVANDGVIEIVAFGPRSTIYEETQKQVGKRL